MNRTGRFSASEIIDMRNNFLVCDPLPDYPYAFQGSNALMYPYNRPTICGGYNGNYNTVCTMLRNDRTWAATFGMTQQRAHFGLAKNPFSDSPMYVAVGSDSDAGPTYEFFYSSTWKVSEKVLPIVLAYECSLFFNSTTLILISGKQNGLTSSINYFISILTEMRTPAPQLIQGRQAASCGRILTDSSGINLM